MSFARSKSLRTSVPLTISASRGLAANELLSYSTRLALAVNSVPQEHRAPSSRADALDSVALVCRLACRAAGTSSLRVLTTHTAPCAKAGTCLALPGPR